MCELFCISRNTLVNTWKHILGRMVMLTSNIYCISDTVLMDLQAFISLQVQENLLIHNAVIYHHPTDMKAAMHIVFFSCDPGTLSIMTIWTKFCSSEFFVMARLWILWFSNQVYTKRFFSFIIVWWKLNPFVSFLRLLCFYTVLGLERFLAFVTWKTGSALDLLVIIMLFSDTVSFHILPPQIWLLFSECVPCNILFFLWKKFPTEKCFT